MLGVQQEGLSPVENGARQPIAGNTPNGRERRYGMCM